MSPEIMDRIFPCRRCVIPPDCGLSTPLYAPFAFPRPVLFGCRSKIEPAAFSNRNPYFWHTSAEEFTFQTAHTFNRAKPGINIIPVLNLFV
jgi:hypothetical protein